MKRSLWHWGWGLYVDKNGQAKDAFPLGLKKEKKEAEPAPKRQHPRFHVRKKKPLTAR